MGVTKEAMTSIIPESWLEWDLAAEGKMALTAPEADMPTAHDAVTPIPGKPNRTWTSWSTR